MAQHRHTVDIIIRKEDYRTIIDNLSNNGTTRVMVYCAGEPHGLQDIAFPHQSEIKVNGKEVKGNTRGLKNKPGTTRPVDITEHFTVVPAPYTFTVTMVYALTTKASGKQEVSVQIRSRICLKSTQRSLPLRHNPLGFMLIDRVEILPHGEAGGGYSSQGLGPAAGGRS